MYKSKEELYFSWYLDELKDAGFISSWAYEPESYTLSEKLVHTSIKQLKTKTKEVNKTVLQGHVYTPDFRIKWNKKALTTFASWHGESKTPFSLINISNKITEVDIKPQFDRHNMNRLFVLNQKWMWQYFRIYIQKVVLWGNSKSLFTSTFTPTKYLTTDKTNKPRSLKYTPRTLSEYLLKLKNDKT